LCAFVRFGPGFHGDTGVRDYLYHRLMTNLPDGGTFKRIDGGGTLLAQAEWYTVLKYRKTGTSSLPGRFDIGIPYPEDLELQKPRPLFAFECGRNKKASNLVREFYAAGEHEGPEPADITKLAREIRHKGLPYGYALEFYDEDVGEANALISALRQICGTDFDRLRVLVLVRVGGSPPKLTLLPAKWAEHMQLNFRADLERIEGLSCARKTPGPSATTTKGAGHLNRVPRGNFLSSCSSEARALIEAIEQRFGRQVRLLFGGNTMTINRRPTGLLLRAEKASNCICDLDPVLSHKLAELANLPIQTSYRIDGTHLFQENVVSSVSGAVDK
jgi:hypothetical protein